MEGLELDGTVEDIFGYFDRIESRRETKTLSTRSTPVLIENILKLSSTHLCRHPRQRTVKRSGSTVQLLRQRRRRFACGARLATPRCAPAPCLVQDLALPACLDSVYVNRIESRRDMNTLSIEHILKLSSTHLGGRAGCVRRRRRKTRRGSATRRRGGK